MRQRDTAIWHTTSFLLPWRLLLRLIWSWNVGWIRDLVLGTLTFLLYIPCRQSLTHFHGFDYHVHTNDSPMHASSADPSFKLKVHIFNCLLCISTQCFTSTKNSTGTNEFMICLPQTWSSSNIPHLRKRYHPIFQSKIKESSRTLSCTSPPPTAKSSPNPIHSTS